MKFEFLFLLMVSSSLFSIDIPDNWIKRVYAEDFISYRMFEPFKQGSSIETKDSTWGLAISEIQEKVTFDFFINLLGKHPQSNFLYFQLADKKGQVSGASFGSPSNYQQNPQENMTSYFIQGNYYLARSLYEITKIEGTLKVYYVLSLNKKILVIVLSEQDKKLIHEASKIYLEIKE